MKMLRLFIGCFYKLFDYTYSETGDAIRLLTGSPTNRAVGVFLRIYALLKKVTV